MTKILLIEDEVFQLELIGDIIRKAGHGVIMAKSGREGLKLFARESDIDVVLTDIVMPDLDGLVVLKTIKDISPATPVIVLTGYEDQGAMLTALRRGAFDFQKKPVSPVELALAIGRASCHHRLIKGQQQKLERLATIESGARRFSSMLGGDLPLEALSQDYKLLESAVNLVAEMLECNRVSIMLLAPDEKTLQVAVSVGMSKKLIKEETRPLKNSVSSYVLDTGEPLLVEDIAKDKRVGKTEYSSKYKTASFVAAPLKLRERIIGTINANDKKDGRRFTDIDLYTISTMSHHVSSALSHAFHATEVKRDRARQKKMSEFLRILVNCLNPDEMLEELLRKCQEIMGAACAGIFIITPDQKELNLELGFNGKKKMSARKAIPVGKSITGKAAQAGKSLVCNDPDNDPGFLTEYEWGSKATIRNALAAPLKLSDTTMGAIRLLNKKGGDFSEADAELLEDLAGSLSIAVRNMKLYEQLNSSINETISANRTLQDLNEKLVMKNRELSTLKGGEWSDLK
jgi:GAF domain-containing protein/DNA-binding response OmpR family regulator